MQIRLTGFGSLDETATTADIRSEKEKKMARKLSSPGHSLHGGLPSVLGQVQEFLLGDLLREHLILPRAGPSRTVSGDILVDVDYL